MQSLPLDLKIRLTEDRIRAWVDKYGEDGVCVSFSGGKDSTVLLHIVRSLYPEVRAVFSNTGLEYPEIRQFAMSHDKVDIVYPDVRFKDVITEYGYPLIGKEVAEAIYYARRIGGGRTHKRNAKTSVTTYERGELALYQHKLPPEQTDSSSREISTANGGGYGTTTTEDVLLQTQTIQRTGSVSGTTEKAVRSPRQVADNWHNYRQGERRRHELKGFKAGVAIQSENIPNRPSQFNKEKYLPLARDLPVKISHFCCNKLKKAPMKKYQKEQGVVPIIGIIAEESRVRMQGWIRTGCNAWDSKNPKSQPLSFWTNQDVLQYIVEHDIPICSVYGDIVSVDENGIEYPPNILTGFGKLKCTGCDRTGCVYCGFGFHNEKGETRFQRLAKTHPKLYEFALGGGGWKDNPDYDPTAPEYDGEWKNWNPKQIWTPNEKGLGMKKVFDLCNEIMGKEFYRYE